MSGQEPDEKYLKACFLEWVDRICPESMSEEEYGRIAMMYFVGAMAYRDAVSLAMGDTALLAEIDDEIAEFLEVVKGSENEQAG